MLGFAYLISVLGSHDPGQGQGDDVGDQGDAHGVEKDLQRKRQCPGCVAWWSSCAPTEDPGFESRQGVRFLGIDIHCSAVVIT
jgi:hypothetical protein